MLTWELENLVKLRYLWEVLASVGYGVVDAVRRSTTLSGAILRDFTFCAETRIYNTTRRADWKRFVDKNCHSFDTDILKVLTVELPFPDTAHESRYPVEPVQSSKATTITQLAIEPGSRHCKAMIFRMISKINV